MKSSALTRFSLVALLSVGALFAAPIASAAHDHEHGATAPANDDQSHAAWLTAAKADYPLDHCVVSGEKLEEGAMGGPVDYVHREDGKPDRLVRFCCKDCVKDFKKDPAKYLKKIDDAAVLKAAHSDHMH
jgi:hypothetical protein